MRQTFILLALSMLSSTGVMLVRTESHTIRFDNRCDLGKPQLVIGGVILSNGEDWTSNGPAQSGIAYLQTGQCQLNGERCALVEFNLNNPACEGFFNGCDGRGATCTSSGCSTAYHNSDDNEVLASCQVNDVGLLITFCPS
ncbi:hypothetical protein BC826DRAFT_92953 [Russula brevipes]|nr:hypothetical protein BC826DRAFT_92953 [Russula brevipes]